MNSVTPEVSLRSWRESDIDGLLGMRNDIALQAQLMAHARGSTADDVKKWAVALSGAADKILLMVVDKSSDRLLGYIQFVGIDEINRCAELGICLDRSAQGFGIGRRAVLMSLKQLELRSIRKVWLRVRDDNINAIRCYEKIGFRHAGMLRDHSWWDGKFRSTIMMEIFLSEVDKTFARHDHSIDAIPLDRTS